MEGAVQDRTCPLERGALRSAPLMGALWMSCAQCGGSCRCRARPTRRTIRRTLDMGCLLGGCPAWPYGARLVVKVRQLWRGGEGGESECACNDSRISRPRLSAPAGRGRGRVRMRLQRLAHRAICPVCSRPSGTRCRGGGARQSGESRPDAARSRRQGRRPVPGCRPTRLLLRRHNIQRMGDTRYSSRVWKQRRRRFQRMG